MKKDQLRKCSLELHFSEATKQSQKKNKLKAITKLLIITGSNKKIKHRIKTSLFRLF